MEGGLCFAAEVKPERRSRPKPQHQLVVHHIQHDQRELTRRGPIGCRQEQRSPSMVTFEHIATFNFITLNRRVH
jgi:hypothetical protein